MEKEKKVVSFTFETNFIEHIQRNSSRYFIAILCVVVLVLSTKGITDESIVSLQGDMPKYLMNGVYFYDFIGDLPITDPFNHAYRYFAKYPSLTLGHHPLLLPVAEVPFYAIFGISVFSARITMVFFMLLAALSWFLLVRSIYDETVACLSSLLFVSTPFIIEHSIIVISEIPTLAIIILSAYFFMQYCGTDKKKYAYAFAVSLLLGIYAKQISVFMIPVFFFYLLITKGLRTLIRKELILSAVLFMVMVFPLVFITLKFSQSNVAWIAKKSMASRLSVTNLLFYLEALWDYHITLPVLLLSLISIIVSIYKRDKRTIIFFLWIICSYILLTSLGIHKNPRYAMYWIPAFCLFAATSVNFFKYRAWKIIATTFLVAIFVYQFTVVYQKDPQFAKGYEEAAKYVVENRKGESVLYSGIKDTGYFIFFVRKHDTDRDLIILRADKILATSKMNRIVEERILKREEIYEILKNYGVGYVVIEDTESGSRSLEWLREEVKSSKFILRKDITLRSNSRKINNIPLSIYEYKEYTAPKEGQKLHMNIPLMGDSIEIPFKDLLR